MKILITGALGHIGSYLLENAFKGHEIFAVDNMLTQRYCSLFNLRNNVKFMETDFSELQDDFLKNMDVVIHLAAITNAQESFANKDQIEEVNFVQTKRFIRKLEAIDNDTLFIFPSSTSVYGKASEQVVEDDPSFVNPQSPYAESKVKIEEVLSKSNLNSVVLRLGTIYGISRGMRFHTAINKFCYQAAFGNPLTVWRENFDQFRPYLGLSDAKNAIEMMAKKTERNGVYNIISDNHRLSDIISIIQSMIWTDSVKLNFVDTPLLNQLPYKVDISKARSIGYEPHENIEASIRRTLVMLGHQIAFAK